MRAWSRAVPFSAGVAAMALAGAEWVAALLSGPGIGNGGVVAASYLGLALAGLFVPAGIAAGVAAAAVAAGADRALPGLWGRALDVWRQSGGRAPDVGLDRRAAGWVLGGAAALALPGAAVAGVHLVVSQHFEVQAFAAILLGIVAVAAAAGALVAAPALAWAAGRAAGAFPAGWALRGVLASMGVAAAGAAVLVVTRVGLGAGILVVPVELAAWAAGSAALAAFLRRRPERGGWRPVAILGALGLVLHGAGAAALPGNEAARGALVGGAPLGARLFAAAVRLTDRDGDGFSRLWTGGECDDTRPDVHLGAAEVPCNGIDDNCEDGDFCRTGAGAGAGVAPGTGAGAGSGTASGAATGTAAAPAVALPAGAPARPNFLVIAVDTLRIDHMGYAGYARPITPRIDALAAGAVRFMRAYAQAPNTPRSFPSIFTGRLPGAIVWQKGALNFPPILPENHTVFEALAAAGWHEVGAFQHYYFTKDRGLAAGFAAWDDEGALDLKDSNTDSPAPAITAKVTAALEELKTHAGPWLLFTHLFEPHGKYLHHDGYTKYGDTWLDKYDSEIEFADHHVGLMLDALDKAGLAASTVVVLLSDHGEAFLEHGFSFHGQTLYDEVLRVPLLVRVPGLAPRAVDAPVRLVDVAPTLLALAGAGPLPGAPGRSLVPLLAGGTEPAPRLVAAEMLPSPAWPHAQLAIVAGGWKIIRKLDENLWELYDLSADPGEKKNLIDERPDRAAEMKALVKVWTESGAPGL